ncbi:MAG: glycosyltransferase family 1 protein [Candidatus Lokiarchaeota archaeon]|nr:glycosyltransferase family 1 protein [Candidatus Lokiarchaeota archaeon]
MKILYVGNFSDQWSADFPRAYGLLNNDHKIVCFDMRFKKNNRDYKKKSNNNYNHVQKTNLFKILIKKVYKILSKILEKSSLDKINKFFNYYYFKDWEINTLLLNEVKNHNYDLVFLTKANNIKPKLILKLNKYSKTWYFFMDPLNIALSMKAYIYAQNCTWASATFSSIRNLFRKYNMNSYFITEGYNEKIFKPILKNKNIDVIFVGSTNSKREMYINYIKKNNINIVCYGKGFNNPPLYLENLAEKFCEAKIVLNFTQGNIGFSDRVFYCMGCKSFLLTEYCKDIESLFERKKHLDWFHDKKDLISLIKYYIENDELREKIAYQGYKIVSKNYTWNKIMKKISNILKKNI